jgi:hypothetical protein
MKNEAEITDYIAKNFAGVSVASAPGGSFYFYDPTNLPDNRRFPFATVVINDDYDQASQLHREGVFRLNICVSKETYRKLFGEPPVKYGTNGTAAAVHDFTALDTLMPHPVYAAQSWVSVLNPADATLETAKELLAESYEIAVQKYNKREKL